VITSDRSGGVRGDSPAHGATRQATAVHRLPRGGTRAALPGAGGHPALKVTVNEFELAPFNQIGGNGRLPGVSGHEKGSFLGAHGDALGA